MPRKIFSVLIILSLFLGSSIYHPGSTSAHSCEYPDVALINYQGGDFNEVMAFSYDPPNNNVAVPQNPPIISTNQGHRFIHGFAVGADGRIYIPVYDGAEKIVSYDADPFSPTYRGDRQDVAAFNGAYGHGVAINKTNGKLYILSSNRQTVYEIDTTQPWPITSPRVITNSSRSAQAFSEFGIEVGPDGLLYVSTWDNTIERYDPNQNPAEYLGVFATGSGSGDWGSRDIAFGPDNNLYASGPSIGNNRVVVRFQGPYGSNPGQPMDAMKLSESNGEWAHGINFHPTTGELFVGNFFSNVGAHVYDYLPGGSLSNPTQGTPKTTFTRTDVKDVQFLVSPSCETGVTPPATSTPMPTPTLQPSATPQPTASPIPGDLDGNGIVNFKDFSDFVALFLGGNPPDVNQSGLGDIYDFSLLVKNFGTGQ